MLVSGSRRSHSVLRLTPAQLGGKVVRPGRDGRCAESALAIVSSMSETLRLTIVYEAAEDGWIVASIPEVPGAHSQGKSREEARENVLDALHGILELRFGEHALSEPVSDSEPIELTIAA